MGTGVGGPRTHCRADPTWTSARVAPVLRAEGGLLRPSEHGPLRLRWVLVHGLSAEHRARADTAARARRRISRPVRLRRGRAIRAGRRLRRTRRGGPRPGHQPRRADGSRPRRVLAGDARRYLPGGAGSPERARSVPPISGRNARSPAGRHVFLLPVPARRPIPHGFERPTIALPGVVNPRLRQGKRLNPQQCLENVRPLWQTVVDQVRAQSLALGVWAEMPPHC